MSELKPDEIALIKRTTAELNEAARRVLGSCMSKECMRYNREAIDAVKREFDYNMSQLFDLLNVDRDELNDLEEGL